MLLTELILSKRGPLAKVWLSAHHERKLSKQQALGVDVEESVDAILTQETEAMALRLSGQLMLGVVRIYSRKVQYLFDDCKETRERISTAFRPGIVDLPEDQIRANKNAITFGDSRNELDLLDWSFNVPGTDFTSIPAPPPQLTSTSKDYGAFNFGRPRTSSIYGGSTSSRHPSQDLDNTSHLDSQDFEGVDLGLDLDGYGDISVEVGRDAMSERSRGDSLGGMGVGNRKGSVFGEEDMGGQGFDGGLDLGLDFSGDFGALDLPQLEADRARRESSALSTPPPVSPPADAMSVVDVTPRTAARIGTLAEQRHNAADRQTGPSKPKRLRLVQADEELELADEDFQAPTADSALLSHKTSYIPQNPDILLMKSMLSRDFLPLIKVGDESLFYAGPDGLPEALKSLFAFSPTILRKAENGVNVDEIERQNKRPRLDNGEEDDQLSVEMGRRQSTVPSMGMGMGGFNDDSFDMGAGFDGPDYTAPLGEDDLDRIALRDNFTTPTKKRMQEQQEREASLAPSRAESIARAIQFEDSSTENILGMFDSRLDSQTQTQTQSQSQQETPSKSVYSVEIRPTAGGRYSKNTGMAMGLVRKLLDPEVEVDGLEGVVSLTEKVKSISLEKISEKTSRRAASSFFFELLVLGTRDCVSLTQQFPFEDVKVQAKPKLWEEISA